MAITGVDGAVPAFKELAASVRKQEKGTADNSEQLQTECKRPAM